LPIFFEDEKLSPTAILPLYQKYIADLKFSDLPSGVVKEAKRRILDTVGVALRALAA